MQFVADALKYELHFVGMYGPPATEQQRADINVAIEQAGDAINNVRA
jgi:hypothetical protein